MIFAQTPLAWPEILNHSVAIGVVLFFGIGLAWVARRLFGVDGIITRQTDVASASLETTTKTLVAQTITLDKLEANATAQQGLCVRHASALETVGGSMAAVDQSLAATREASESVAKEWGHVNHQEFRTPPILDALTHTVDMLEKMEIRRGHADECREEFALLRSQIAEIKREMTRGTQ